WGLLKDGRPCRACSRGRSWRQWYAASWLALAQIPETLPLRRPRASPLDDLGGHPVRLRPAEAKEAPEEQPECPRRQQHRVALRHRDLVAALLDRLEDRLGHDLRGVLLPVVGDRLVLLVPYLGIDGPGVHDRDVDVRAREVVPEALAEG